MPGYNDGTPRTPRPALALADLSVDLGGTHTNTQLGRARSALSGTRRSTAHELPTASAPAPSTTRASRASPTSPTNKSQGRVGEVLARRREEVMRYGDEVLRVHQPMHRASYMIAVNKRAQQASS